MRNVKEELGLERLVVAHPGSGGWPHAPGIEVAPLGGEGTALFR